VTVTYLDRSKETLCREALEALQLKRLRETLAKCFKAPFYRERLIRAGVNSPDDLERREDINRLPFTTKDDLRSAFPYGLLAADRSRVVRLHASSGTTGIPTVIYHTAEDIEAWTELTARSIVATGASRDDVFQNMMSYGLFTGGLGLHYGAERVGMMVIPSGAGNTTRQLKLMKDFQTTVVHATPSYLLHVQSKMEEEGIARSDLHLTKAFVGAEPHSENTRKKIERLCDIDVYNSYGLSEMNGPGVAFECLFKEGMHVWEDAFLLEVVDPQTGVPVRDGEQGELVFTTLQRTATPLLRYRSRDLSSVRPEPCNCGRVHRRIERIKGRTDDLLIINGVNVFPSQIEEVIMKVPQVGTNYLITVEKAGALDKLVVQTEVTSEIFSDDMRKLNALRDRIKALLKASISINARVELHERGALPVSQGKAQRVIDRRAPL
jgi:phenylacetate-CoA ligase